MSDITEINEGQILTGVMFNEPMRVVTTRQSGAGPWSRGWWARPPDSSAR